jgi:hypothetical protein
MDAYADALGIAEPKGTPEAKLRAQASGDMGADPAALAREIAAVRADLAKPLDAASKALLQGHLSTLQQQGASAPSAPSAPKADPYASALGIGAPVQTPASAAPSATPVDPLKIQAPNIKGADEGVQAVALNQLTGIGSSIVGGYRGLSTLLTGGTLEDAANNVRDYQEGHTYSPDSSTAGGKAIASFASPGNPLNWPGLVANKAGEVTTDLTGSPAAGAAINTGLNAAVLALGMRGRPGTVPVEVGPARPATGIYRPVGVASNPALPAPGEGTALAQEVPQNAPRQPVRVAVNPEAAQPIPTTPEALQAVAQSAPAKLFPETPTTAPAGRFSPQEQASRAKILESVGIDSDKLRRSAVSGDGTGGSTDFQTAKLDSDAGRHMKSIIEGEKAALTNHADSLVGETGGTHGVDQSALYARGNTILAPLDGMKQWFDSKTSALYKAADERAGGVPTKLDGFKAILDDSSELTNSDRVHLQSAVNAYIKKLGMAGEDGSVAGTAKQAETIRKYLNEQWSPQNSKLVGKLKDALDEDVTASAGTTSTPRPARSARCERRRWTTPTGLRS